jgi:leucyl/phenylalanyl-tRNA--protein transferase
MPALLEISLAGSRGRRYLRDVPVYLLDDSRRFPPPARAEPSGLLAIGGDLSPERLLAGYAGGIFPWYSEDEPILWFSPDPRAVIVPSRLRTSRGVRRTLSSASALTLTMDTAFAEVIRACAAIDRPGQDGTWITADMIEAYARLHELGFAHSVEAWEGERLVGGVYGVSLGSYFAAESMFRLKTGASMRALVALLRQLAAWDFELLDCQMFTPHVGRLGAELWPRRDFLTALERAVAVPTRRGRWRFDGDTAL